MALEAIGSIMSVQNQTIQKAAEPKPAVENTEVSSPEQVANVDAMTISVAKADNKDGQDGQGGQSGQNQGMEKSAAQQTREAGQNSNEKIKKAVEKLNQNMPHSEAVFGIHDDTNRVTIKIVDKDTKEVIKEFPPEATLDMIARVWELAGILVDEKL